MLYYCPLCRPLQIRAENPVKAERLVRIEERLEEVFGAGSEAPEALENVLRLLVLLEGHGGDDSGLKQGGQKHSEAPYFAFKSALGEPSEAPPLPPPTSHSKWTFASLDHLATSDRSFPEFFGGFTPLAKVEETSSRTFKIPERGLFAQEPGSGLAVLRVGRREVAETTKRKIPPLELLLDGSGGRPLRTPGGARSKAETGDKQTEDDGYLSSSEASAGPSECIWEVARTLDAPGRRTWENLGNPLPPKEPPYLLELGSEAVHRAWLLAMENLRLVDPRTPVPKLRVLGREQLVQERNLEFPDDIFRGFR